MKSMQIKLRVEQGPNRGHQFSFEGHDTFIVGRGRTAHMKLPPKDKFFSRNHFMIELNPPLCRLIDMASSNGTFVNGQRVDETDLRDGDEIRAGDTTIRIEFEGSPSPQETHRVVQGTGRNRPTMSADQDDKSHSTGQPNLKTTEVCQQKPQSVAGTRVAEATPLRVGRFDLIRELGRGGMGVVYLARNVETSRTIALKILSAGAAASEREISRFLREAAILGELKHPHIVRYYESGQDGQQIHFAMEYVEGTDTASLLARRGPFDIAKAVRFACHVLAALDYAHNRGYVHRDVKPANVLVHNRDDRKDVKLADFGLARVYQTSRFSGLTLQGEMGGSLPFMPPEHLSNYREAKPPGDQFAVAATLYNWLTDQYIHDFPERTGPRVLAVLQNEAVPIRQRRAEIPEALASLIHQALDRKPERRFSSAAIMRDQLLPFAVTNS